jgi:hypothetical protein
VHNARWWSRVAVLVAGVYLGAGCASSTEVRSPAPSDTAVPVGAPVNGVNPRVETTPGAQTTVVTYGPLTVPAAKGSGHEQAGMIENRPAPAPMPCRDCYITGFEPTLTFSDGTIANYDNGAMLHHFVIFARGKRDATCGDQYAGLGSRVFAGGNERVTGTFPAGTGYRIGPDEDWLLLADLMNLADVPHDLQIRITYRWVPASTPGMRGALPIWLDVGPCGSSWVKAGQGQFSYKATWTVNVPGEVLGVAGHLHDGGTRVTVRNLATDQLLCESDAGYGGPGYDEPPSSDAAHGMDHGTDPGVSPPAGSHLSSMSQCVGPTVDHPVGVLEQGQPVEVEAFYDDGTHARHEDHVMGIAFLFVLP